MLSGSALARELEWSRTWDTVLSAGDHPHVYGWFRGGRLNLSNLALDRHAKTWRKNKVALIWEGEPTDENGAPKEVRKYTYGELLREVDRFAFALRTKFGLKKGDKVAVYLPLIPEAIVTLLAAARLGLTFTVVFSGYSADSLSSRINDLGARLLITADGFYRRGRQVLLKEIADAALEQTPSVENVVVVKRLAVHVPDATGGRDFEMRAVLSEFATGSSVEPEPVESDHPLYVLYTSGTTGKPKGLIRDTGGYAVLLHATMKWAFDIHDRDVYWCPADIGWVTGHSYVAFGPLIEGATVVLYEGAIDTPQYDRWWSIVERYGVSILYTTPTATRSQMRFGDDATSRSTTSRPFVSFRASARR